MSLISCSSSKTEVIKSSKEVAIQPLGNVPKRYLEIVANAIRHEYKLSVKTLPERAVPKSAYYAPRQRYRASKILNYLEEIHKESEKIIGITTKDISVTNGKHFDWGIFGLANLGGTSCVVSTFRLRAKNTSNSSFEERLRKVAIHELGHARFIAL